MRSECNECGATYSAAHECRICAKPLAPTNNTLLSPAETDRLRSAHAQQVRPAPVRGGSGLIDIRQMSARLRAEVTKPAPMPMPLAAGSAGGLLLPSFAGDGLDGLSATPLLTPQSSARTSDTRSRGPLYALLTVLTLGVLGLGALVVVEEFGNEPTPTIAAAAPTLDAEQPEQATEPEPETEPEDAAAAEPDESPEQAEEPTPDKPAATRPRPRTRPRPSTSKPSSQPSKPTTSSTPAPSKKLDDDALVDCLLGSSSPKCKKSSTPTPSPSPGTKPSTSDAKLPTKLGQSQIIDGIRPIKSAVKGCSSGVTVAVKFSVEGATGRVLSAKALDEHASSSAGACVVKAARKAEFDKFSAARQGFTFKFRL